MTVGITIYHNPDCGTSRNVLGLLRRAGAEPRVIEYLKTPPSGDVLRDLAARAGLSLRELLREKGTPFAALGLGDAALAEAALLSAIADHPVLINRPIVVTPRGVRLCRPSDVVLDLLDEGPMARLEKEEGVPFLRSRRLPADDAGLRAALAAEGQPTDDLAGAGNRFFAFETLDGAVVGRGGFELFGADALLRSLVVAPGARGAGLGRNIVPLLLYRAREAGARRAFLLTTGAAPFFERLGFRALDRAEAPAALLASPQAARLCPASAVLMTRKIGF